MRWLLAATATAFTIAGAAFGFIGGITASTRAQADITEAHAEADALFRVTCARAAVAGLGWKDLANRKAVALTGWAGLPMEGE